MKTVLIAALAALASAGAAGAQVPTKAGIQPRTWAEVRADKEARTAKAQRQEAVRLASRETHERHEEAFGRVDMDGNGRINLDEFKEAALHLEGLGSTTNAAVGR